MIVVEAGITNVVEQKEVRLDIRYQQIKEIALKKSFSHAELHHRGLLKALYTFLNVNGGEGIGDSNQVFREREKALLKIPFILRLFATYSILLSVVTHTMNSKYIQQVRLRVKLSQLCPAWRSVVCYSSDYHCLDQPDGSCVGLFHLYTFSNSNHLSVNRVILSNRRMP